MSNVDAAFQLVAGQVPILRSDRLLLRPLHEGDAQAIQSLVNHFEVARWMGRIPYPYTIDDAVYFIKEIAPSEISWGIENFDHTLIGVGGFVIRPEGLDVELGYWLGQAFWGQGYATEAAGSMLEHAWSSGAPRILSGCFQGNARSQHVLEKLGFRVVGRSTRYNRAHNADISHLDMAVERSTPPDVRKD